MRYLIQICRDFSPDVIDSSSLASIMLPENVGDLKEGQWRYYKHLGGWIGIELDPEVYRQLYLNYISKPFGGSEVWPLK